MRWRRYKRKQEKDEMRDTKTNSKTLPRQSDATQYS